MQPSRPPAEVITERLTHYLGPHTARVAVKSFSERELGLHPESLTIDDVPKLLEALRPMLKTMLGADRSDVVIRALGRDLVP
jgi:hypothetical protein